MGKLRHRRLKHLPQITQYSVAMSGSGRDDSSDSKFEQRQFNTETSQDGIWNHKDLWSRNWPTAGGDSISRDAAQTKTAGTAPGFTSLLPCLHLLGFHWPKLVRNRGVRTMGSLPAAPRPLGHRTEAGGGGQRQKETPRVCLRGPLTCIPPHCG